MYVKTKQMSNFAVTGMLLVRHLHECGNGKSQISVYFSNVSKQNCNEVVTSRASLHPSQCNIQFSCVDRKYIVTWRITLTSRLGLISMDLNWKCWENCLNGYMINHRLLWYICKNVLS